VNSSFGSCLAFGFSLKKHLPNIKVKAGQVVFLSRKDESIKKNYKPRLSVPVKTSFANVLEKGSLQL